MLKLEDIKIVQSANGYKVVPLEYWVNHNMKHEFCTLKSAEAYKNACYEIALIKCKFAENNLGSWPEEETDSFFHGL